VAGNEKGWGLKGEGILVGTRHRKRKRENAREREEERNF